MTSDLCVGKRMLADITERTEVGTNYGADPRVMRNDESLN
jgi:hypothetical protein